MDDGFVKAVASYIVEMVTSPFYVVKDISMIFQDYGIDYAVTGAVAMGIHNYKRSTKNVDILVSQKGYKTLRDKLIGKYFDLKPGTKNLYYNTSFGKVAVDITVEGENISGMEIPNPTSIRAKINGIYYISLPKLVEFKLAGGYQKMREKDWPDTIRLIRENELSRDYWKHFPHLKEKYMELWEQADKKG
jgi:hypothetical protein